jgi:flagellar motor switch protein FliG
MPNDETKTIPPVKIGPEDLERILRKFEEELLKEERLRKGDDSFLKTSSIDKPIDQPDLS